MAQQIIDFGSFPNDPTADPIRAAFQKVQDNFTDLYSQLLSTGVTEVTAGVGLAQNRSTGNVALTANISSITIKTSGFTNSTNSLRVGVLTTPSTSTATISQYNTPFTIDLAPNITTVNANFTGSLFTANFSMTGNVNSSLIPGTTEIYDLGNSTHRWKDLYLSGNSLSLGTVTVTDPYGNGTLQIGTSVVTGNIDAGNITAGVVSGNLATASQPNITSVGTLTSLTVATSITAANMTVSGAFSAGTIFGNVVLPPGGNIQAPGDDMQVIFNDSGNQKAVAGMTFNKTSSLLTIQGNISGGNIQSGNATFTGNIGVNKVVATGNVEGSNIVTLGVVSSTSGLTTGANLAITNISGDGTNVTVTFATQTTTPFAAGTSITITGVTPSSYNGTWTVASGNASQITFSSSLTATATYVGARIKGNGDSTINGLLTVVGNTSFGNITAVNRITGNIIQVSGNVDSGNLISQGILQVTGTANLGSIYTGGNASILGNLTAGSANIANFVISQTGSVNGNIFTAQMFTGNGANITFVNAANVQGIVANAANATTALTANVANNIIQGTFSNITGVGTLTSLSISGTGSISGANVVSATYLTGILTTAAQPNVTSLGTLSDLTIAGTGTVSGANIVSATYLMGNGYYITNVPGSVVSGTVASATSATSATNATTATTANALATTNNYQVNSFGVGTAPSGTAGEIRATNNITAYYSDDRLKTRLGKIENALDMIDQLDGFYYEENELAISLGYTKKRQVGLSAQQMKKVMPEIVTSAPIDPETYLTIWYEKTAPLLIEGIKELRKEINAIKTHIGVK